MKDRFVALGHRFGMQSRAKREVRLLDVVVEALSSASVTCMRQQIWGVPVHLTLISLSHIGHYGDPATTSSRAAGQQFVPAS